MTLLRILIAFSCLWLSACSDDQNPTQTWVQSAAGAYAADISHNGRYSIMSSVDGDLSLWQLEPQKLIFNWQHQEQQSNQVFLVKFAEKDRYAVTASRSDFVIWDVQQGDALGYWSLSESSIRDIAISSDARYVLIGLGDGKVLHIDLNNGRRLEFLGHSEKINSIALSANGRYALTGSNDYQALLWDTQSAQVILRFPHKGRVSMVALDPDGRYAFTADSGKQARIWHIPSGDLVSSLKLSARQTIFTHVRFINDGQWLATGSGGRRLSLWHTNSGHLLQRWQVSPRQKTRPKSAVVYSAAMADNSHLLSASSSGTIEQWPIKQ